MNNFLQSLTSRQANNRLDNRHQALALTNKSIPSKIMHLGFNSQVYERTSPRCKTRARFVILLATNCKGIKSLHDSVTICTWKRVNFQVGLHTGNDISFSDYPRGEFANVRPVIASLKNEDKCSDE
jgi:hypothetical protein